MKTDLTNKERGALRAELQKLEQQFDKHLADHDPHTCPVCRLNVQQRVELKKKLGTWR